VVIAGERALVRRAVEAADMGATAGPTDGPTAAPVTGAATEVVAAGRVDRLQQAT
jgi:hypothetical protein